MAEINQLKAIDNHSHPPALDGPHGEKDDDFDALPCDPLEPTDSGLMFREDNPVYIKAWQMMFGYKYADFKPDHVKELLAAKQQVKQREGDNYPNWVLDQLGIETELANRVALGPGLKPPRFRWVAFDDILLFPLNNSSLAAQSPDRKVFLRTGRLTVEALPEAGGRKCASGNAAGVHGNRRNSALRAPKEKWRSGHQVRSRLPALARLRARQ